MLTSILKGTVTYKNLYACSIPVLSSRGTSAEFPISGKRSYHGSTPPPPQQSSLFRSLIGLTVVIGGVSTAIYLNRTTRDYFEAEVPQLKPTFAKLDDYVSCCQEKISTFQLPSLPAIFQQGTTVRPTGSDYQPKSFNRGQSSPMNDNLSVFSSPSISKTELPEEVNLDPSLPSVDEIRSKVAHFAEKLKPTQKNLHTAITNAEQSVREALTDLQHLEMVTKRHLDELHGTKNKWPSSKLTAKLESAQRKANASHQAAQQYLSQLRASLDAAKESALSTEEMEDVKMALSRYGDFSYELSGLVNKIRILQNQAAILVDFTKSTFVDQQRLQEEIQSILPKTASGKPTSKEGGEEITDGEKDSLLLMVLERLNRLYDNIETSKAQDKRRLDAVLQAHRQIGDRLLREAVEHEVAKLVIQHELDRMEWEKEAAKRTEKELEAALARHSHHLAQMLRLKQEGMEQDFAYLKREALAVQKEEIEGELAKWIYRMKAIEHVVDGRADIDRIAKETQALWLAVESLAYALEMPFSKISTSGLLDAGELKPFYTSEPLMPLVEAVRKAAEATGREHEFPLYILDSLPEEALSQGVWTRQGLLHRFNKVYQMSCNVAMVPETSDSIWRYFLSWMQSKLLFDRLGRRRIISHLPGLSPALLTPETPLPDNTSPDTFLLLASAKAALIPETAAAVNVDPTNCTDIEFAVRLLGQLKGQSAIVAADWLQDARRFLEVYQAIQSLLAYVTAQNISAFEKRL